MAATQSVPLYLKMYVNVTSRPAQIQPSSSKHQKNTLTFQASSSQVDKLDSPRQIPCSVSGNKSHTVWHGYHAACFGDIDFSHSPSSPHITSDDRDAFRRRRHGRAWRHRWRRERLRPMSRRVGCLVC